MDKYAVHFESGERPRKTYKFLGLPLTPFEQLKRHMARWFVAGLFLGLLVGCLSIEIKPQPPQNPTPTPTPVASVDPICKQDSSELNCNCWNAQNDGCWHYDRCPGSFLPAVDPVCDGTAPMPTPTPESRTCRDSSDCDCWYHSDNKTQQFRPCATPTPTPSGPGEAPGRICRPQGSDNVADCDCWHLPPWETSWQWSPCHVAPTPTPTPEATPTPTPSPSPTPTPVPNTAVCEKVLPNTPVRVDKNYPAGVPTVGPVGRRMAKSACLSTDPIAPGVGGNGACFADNMAPGTDPELLAMLRKHECFWGKGIGRWDGYDECYLYEPKSRIIDAPNSLVNKDGLFVDVNFDPSTGDTAVDFYGRAVSYKGGTPHIIQWQGPGTLPNHPWGRNSLVPPLVVGVCPEPTPTPTPTPVPTPTPEPTGTGCLDRVVRIGVEWGLQAGGDRCKLPGPNQDLNLDPGKDCHLYASASSKDGSGLHVGDDPECFTTVAPYWIQDHPQCDARDDCVDIGVWNPDPNNPGTWVRVPDDPGGKTHGFFAKFDLGFKKNQGWLQACLDTPHGPVCTKQFLLGHQ